MPGISQLNDSARFFMFCATENNILIHPFAFTKTHFPWHK